MSSGKRWLFGFVALTFLQGALWEAHMNTKTNSSERFVKWVVESWCLVKHTYPST